jgi:hypothetical protein
MPAALPLNAAHTCCTAVPAGCCRRRRHPAAAFDATAWLPAFLTAPCCACSAPAALSQVVELPRQKPDAALALFAGVAARLRILVVGGDGSVAWILSCLEALKEEQAARGNLHWKPPPVGVLPLGTGARRTQRARRATVQVCGQRPGLGPHLHVCRGMR